MKRIYLFIFIGLFLISFVNAEKEICIDFDEPSAPANLEVTSSGTNIILTWDAATDEPSCSGIANYTIKRKNPDNSITDLDINNNILNFIDKENLAEGSYSYIVYATDKVGHLNSSSIINDVVIEEVGGKKKVRGGAGSSSYVCESNWECTDWSECIRGFRTRICHDTNNCSYSYNKPIQRTDCETTFNLEGISLEKEPSEEGFFSRITGAAIGGITDFAKSGSGALVFVVLIVAAGGFVLFRVYKLRKR